MICDLASKGFATRAVHAGERVRRDSFIPISTPIYSSATFLYDTLEEIDAISAGSRPGFTYSRHGNPTNAALEEAVAALEGGDVAVSFSSGMAALLLALLGAGVEQGSTVVASQDLYGVTMKALTDVVARWGVEVQFVEVADVSALARQWAERPPRVLLLESLSNPLLRVPDLPALIAAAQRTKTRVIVDNTFATPMLVQPLKLRADFVVHSATKYLGGHGDLIGGLAVCRTEFAEEMRHFSRLVGAVLGPFEAWLALRGLKTLPLRIARQSENARQLAGWLETHPKVECLLPWAPESSRPRTQPTTLREWMGRRGRLLCDSWRAPGGDLSLRQCARALPKSDHGGRFAEPHSLSGSLLPPRPRPAAPRTPGNYGEPGAPLGRD
jgi:cystathionine beta-lyase/cystathionine gamma-synthase